MHLIARLRIVAIGFILTGATAAATAGQTLSAGFAVGLRSSTLHVPQDDDTNYQFLTRARGGVFLQTEITGAVGARVGAFLVPKGTAMEFEIFNSPLSATIDLDYVDIPIQVLYTFPGDRVRPYFVAGPIIGFRLSCGFTVSNGTETADLTCDDDGDEATLDTAGRETAVGVGVGIRVPVGVGQLQIEVGYEHGLTNVIANPSMSSRHRALDVSLGMTIPMFGGR